MNFLKFKNQLTGLFPGVLICIMIALSAEFVSSHYGAPSMLIALLFGISLNFLSKEGKAVSGIKFSASKVLRFGIALLGLKISFDLVLSLGASSLLLIVFGVIATIIFGLALSSFFGHKKDFAFLTAGSVAICGASAAIAISAILPKHKNSDDWLVFTVVGVTLLSTIAMIIYPILANLLGLNEVQTGIFLGATIHDVAQVVGAGFSVSNETGELSTLVKLIRVSMLAPIVIIASLIIHSKTKNNNQAKVQIIPFFVLGFIILATLNSFGFIPEVIKEPLGFVSRCAILVSIAAVGMKTSLEEMSKLGKRSVILIFSETLFIALFILTGLFILS